MVNGRTICKRAKELSYGNVAACTRENIGRVRSMERVYILGMMAVSTMVDGKRTRYTERDCTSGRMEEPMMEIGLRAICMEKVYTGGQTGDATRATTSTIANMDTVCSTGWMVGKWKEIGRRERCTAKEYIRRMEDGAAGYGKTGSVKSG
jgi:hypothetical protein